MPIIASHCSRCDEYSLNAYRLGPMPQFTQLYEKVQEIQPELCGSNMFTVEEFNRLGTQNVHYMVHKVACAQIP